MDYAEARATFFQPRAAGAGEAGTARWRSPARRLRDAIEPLAMVFAWGEPAYDACAAAGLTGLEANILTEMQVGWPSRSYTATRGWAPEAMDRAEASLAQRGLIAGETLTSAGATLRADIEERTDRQLAPVIHAIGPFVETLIPVLDGWSGRIIEHGWFPPDPFKRASG